MKNTLCAVLYFLILIAITCGPLLYAESNRVSLGVLIEGGSHRKDFNTQLREFKNRHPDIELTPYIKRGARYLDMLRQVLEEQAGPDIVFWYGGHRITHYANRGLIQDIEPIWQKYNLESKFPKRVVEAVKVNGKAYAIPITYFYVGLFANIKVFEKAGIGFPESWQEILRACDALRAMDIDLFALGSKTAWTTHGWFDYINLRLNGLEFHRLLLSGTTPYTDERVKNTMRHWKALLDSNCFNKNHQAYDRERAFPRILHNQSASILAGSVPNSLSLESFPYIELRPFPSFNKNIPKYTLSPVNVFIVPAYTKITPSIEKVLLFLAEPQFQEFFNHSLDHIPPNISANKSSPIIIKGEKIIKQSPGGIQYFDRDTDIDFAKHTPAIFVNFLSHRDIDKTVNELELLRMKVFSDQQ